MILASNMSVGLFFNRKRRFEVGREIEIQNRSVWLQLNFEFWHEWQCQLDILGPRSFELGEETGFAGNLKHKFRVGRVEFGFKISNFSSVSSFDAIDNVTLSFSDYGFPQCWWRMGEGRLCKGVSVRMKCQLLFGGSHSFIIIALLKIITRNFLPHFKWNVFYPLKIHLVCWTSSTRPHSTIQA